jgi:hypothetical protein
MRRQQEIAIGLESVEIAEKTTKNRRKIANFA